MDLHMNRMYVHQMEYYSAFKKIKKIEHMQENGKNLKTFYFLN